MMDGMEDLVQWLRAQLDDDERVARDAGGRNWRREAYSCVVDAADDGLIVYGEGTPSSEQADHIARHDPAQILREVEAKRRRLAFIERLANYRDSPQDSFTTITVNAVRTIAVNELLWTEAMPYADRPGFREEWRL